MLVFIFLSYYSSFVSMYFYLILRRDGWCKVGVSSLHFNANEQTIFCDSFSDVWIEEKEEEISICKWEPEASIAKTKLSCGREHMFRRKALYFLSLFWWRALMVCLFYKCGSIESVRMYVSTGRFFCMSDFLKVCLHFSIRCLGWKRGKGRGVIFNIIHWKKDEQRRWVIYSYLYIC